MRWAKPKTIRPNQKSIFDQSEAAKQRGIELSYRNAPTYFKNAAREALHDILKSQPEFSADDIWIALGEKGITTGEPRALGAIIQGAARAGLIKPTGNYVKSIRRHGSPIPLWISNIYEANHE